MTLAIVRLYFETALLLALGLGLLAGARRLFARAPARLWLRLGYALLIASFALPLVARSSSRPAAFFPAPMQVEARTAGGVAHVSVAVTSEAAHMAPRIEASAITWAALLLLLASALGVAHLARELRRLSRLCRSLTPVRAIGRVTLCVGGEGSAPFSLWTGRRGYVVLPPAFLLDPARLRMALSHELEHLRARDTGWAYAAALVRALLPWHPAAHHWGRLLSRLQELTCDERVVGAGRHSPRAYGECLVWAAERTTTPHATMGAVAMLDGSRSFLESRIRRILAAQPRPRRGLGPLAALLCFLPLAGAAAISHGAVADHRLSLEEARALAARVERETGFRVPVDETVRVELDRMLGNEQERTTFREALARLIAMRPALTVTLTRHGVPAALLAIPLVESGFKVLPAANNRSRTAGLWQLIPETARNHGLRVDGSVDDRLDPARDTDAAAAYLAQSFAAVGDWPLTIAVYNNGITRVKRAIASAGGVRDAGALVSRKLVSRYSSAVLAAVLLMHAPELVQ